MGLRSTSIIPLVMAEAVYTIWDVLSVASKTTPIFLSDTADRCLECLVAGL